MMMLGRDIATIAAAAVLVASCALTGDRVDWHDSPAPPGPQGPQDGVKLALAEEAGPLLTPDSRIQGQDLADLNEWISTTTAVLRSPQFRTNMAALEQAHPDIWLSRNVGTMRPSALPPLLESPTGSFRYLPTRIIWRTNRQHKISVGSDPQTGHSTALLHVGLNHLSRYRSTDPVERSCAVNSLAHEITHTVSASSTRFVWAVTDTGGGRRGAGDNALASYFVGTVAQCTHLQAIGRVTAQGLNQCVQTFGTRAFFGKRCDDFEGGEAVGPPRG